MSRRHRVILSKSLTCLLAVLNAFLTQLRSRSRRHARPRLAPLSGSGCALLLTLICQLAMMDAAHAVQDTVTTYQYDAQGNLKRTISPLDSATNPVREDYNYDTLDHATDIFQAIPIAGQARPRIQLAYDGLGQLTWVSDARANQTVTDQTGLGDNTGTSSPDTGFTENTFDAAGNLKTSTDARGILTTYTYDALNRLTCIEYGAVTANCSGAGRTQFSYDMLTVTGASATGSVGKLTRMSDEAGTTLYGYDSAGRLTSKIQTYPGSQTSWSQRLDYAYGSSGTGNGKLAGVTYPSGNRINYTYDAAGRINAISLNPANSNGIGPNTAVSTPLLSTIQYSPTGQLLSAAFGNHTATNPNLLTRGIDLDGRINQYPLGQSQNGGTVRTLSYDPASRITGMSHTGSGTGTFAPANFNQSVTYDNLGRINSFTGPGGTLTYNYDANGNRISKGADSYTVDAFSNKLLKTTATGLQRTYDASGHLSSDGTTTYTYSTRGRLSQVQQGGNTTLYLYNGLEQRLIKSGFGAAGNSLSQYVYDEAGHLLGEYDYYGKTVQETVYLGDLPIAALTQSYSTGTAIVVDNSDATKTAAAGTWAAATAIPGYTGTNYQTHAALTGVSSDSFTWKFTLASAGRYQFSVSWPGDSTRATSVSYSATGPDGTTTRGTSQRTATAQISAITLGWKTTTAANSQVSVTLAPSTTGTVAADAVTAYPMTVNTAVNYIYADHLDTPRVITRASDNKMVWRWDNTDPFGVIQPNTNPASLGAFTYNPRFPGQVYDPETGLNYNIHRSYEAGTGRYTTSDPIGVKGGWNTYAYVGGNPVNLVDPTGENAVTDGAKWGWNLGTPLGLPGKIGGAIIGAGIGGVIGDAVSDALKGKNAANDDTYDQCPIPDECELELARIIKKEIAIQNDIQSGPPRFGPNAGNEIFWASEIRAKKKAWNEWVDNYNRRCPRKIGRRFKL